MMNQELTYWVSLALMPRLRTRRKNEIYIACYNREPRVSIVELFDNRPLWSELKLSDEEVALFHHTREQLSNHSFLVESLLSQGYNILPIDSPHYPRSLKDNMKQNAPSVLFGKGDISMLQEPSVAIVGSRNADATSLAFTRSVAAKQAAQAQVVVSGFAKGVDRTALDAAIASGGKSIIVLPQGITTFASGFREYYKPIMQGKVLVVSTFQPNAP
ncbi:MAG: DNA-processing protein DprA [Muribaculaceae bacterium]|nr:DNA-processing protein DprA [Muribaculaceae bacterium]